MTADMISALITLAVWAGFWIVDRYSPWPAWMLGFGAGFYAPLAVLCMAYGGVPLSMGSAGGFAAWCAYQAWKRRPPRQRKPSKVAGIVRDLGHRLVVTHG